ncbi:hypothetical protein CU102_22075 [Phyllobacterium brassicacearum]|uniref:Phage holin family protein n=1 Tax=Phyllobacterium brassicacearum TaxID=314235 RepID=A0A2P7BD27_9HYPH|nr:hypothetical protein [Phyllobacterium brassicacearum]PSH64374.1 hypothetical protein CU102_22075 [Phyllobacterium brassicacearum]TDQ21299.1 hypothetical protein DEV91_12086 [Phyllobacterium brassicacearum]
MLKLLTPFLTSLAAGEVGLAIGKAKRSAIFMAIIAILAAIGVFFLLIAAYIMLAERHGEMRASLILAGCAFGMAILVYVIMKISVAMARSRQRDRAKIETSTLLTIAALAAAPAVLRSRALLMLAVPIVAFGGLSLLTRKKTRRPDKSDMPSAGDGI